MASLSAPDAWFRAYARGLMPPPDYSIEEWAEREIVLATEESRLHGAYRIGGRVPFFREILEKMHPNDPTEEIVVMKGVQIGLTTLLKVIILYYMKHAPTSILLYLPTNEDAKDTVLTKILPSLEQVPGMSASIEELRSRGRRSSMLNIRFPGGTLRTRGAKSPRAFRRTSAQIVLFDDYDGAEPEISEGYIGDLGRQRAATYDNRKIVFVSNPTFKNASSIEKEFLKFDQRKYFVPCPHCKELDIIRWSAIRYSDESPQDAVLMCLNCEKPIPEHHKEWMLENGVWKPTREGPSPPYKHSYQLPGLYAPLGWRSWGQCAQSWLAAQNDPPALRVFVNQDLAETYEVRGSGAKPDPLMQRREPYARKGEVPNGVGVLTAAVDTHLDRLEVFVWGWGAAEESWFIDHHVIEGDPVTDSKPWFELDQYRRRLFPHVNGRQMPLSRVMIDSGGPSTSETHASDVVYRYAKTRYREGVRAVKGDRAQGRPIIGNPTRKNAYGVRLYLVCTDSAKETIYRRLNIGLNDPEERAGGPGYIHLPTWMSRELIEQLTSQRGVWKKSKTGVMVRVWDKQRERDEMLDGFVYSLAGLRNWGEANIRTLPERARRWAVPAKPAPAAPPASNVPQALINRQRRRRSWVGGFNNRRKF